MKYVLEFFEYLVYIFGTFHLLGKAQIALFYTWTCHIYVQMLLDFVRVCIY